MELAQPAEREALRGPNSSLPVLYEEFLRELEPDSTQWHVPKNGRQTAYVETKVQTGCKQNILTDKDNHTCRQVAQRGCVVSVLEGFKDQAG